MLVIYVSDSYKVTSHNLLRVGYFQGVSHRIGPDLIILVEIFHNQIHIFQIAFIIFKYRAYIICTMNYQLKSSVFPHFCYFDPDQKEVRIESASAPVTFHS